MIDQLRSALRIDIQTQSLQDLWSQLDKSSISKICQDKIIAAQAEASGEAFGAGLLFMLLDLQGPEAAQAGLPPALQRHMRSAAIFVIKQSLGLTRAQHAGLCLRLDADGPQALPFNCASASLAEMLGHGLTHENHEAAAAQCAALARDAGVLDMMLVFMTLPQIAKQPLAALPRSVHLSLLMYLAFVFDLDRAEIEDLNHGQGISIDLRSPTVWGSQSEAASAAAPYGHEAEVLKLPSGWAVMVKGPGPARFL